MNFSYYEFECQKAIHQSLQYAKSLGHQTLEVEHVALFLLRQDLLDIDESLSKTLQLILERHLSVSPRIFGNLKIAFGMRLDAALIYAENISHKDKVSPQKMWEGLVRNSTLLQNVISKYSDQKNLDNIQDKDLNTDSDSKSSSSSNIYHLNTKDSSTYKTSSSSRYGSSRVFKENKNIDNDTKVKKDKNINLNSSTSKNNDSSDQSFNSLNLSSLPKYNENDLHQKQDTVKNISKDKEKEIDISEKLKEFTIDLSALAERGELDPVIGRDLEVRRVLEILGRKKKNNPILIGEPGVGKTAIVEALALTIVEGKCPEYIKSQRVLSLDLGAVLAGTKYRGEFESRIKELLKILETLSGKVILFIDEIHMIAGAGGSEGSLDAANLLKPALARGTIHCLGATTLEEYKKYIESDSALERRFQPVHVLEPNRATAIAMLRGLKPKYEVYHGVGISDEALIAAVDLSVRYINFRQLPDKAIDLIDEAASKLRLEIDSLPSVLSDLKSQIDQLEMEKEAIGGEERINKKSLAVINVKLDKVKKEFERIEAVWSEHQNLLEAVRKLEAKRLETISILEKAKGSSDFEFASKIQYKELPKIEEELLYTKEALHKLHIRYPFLRLNVGKREIAEVVSDLSGVPIVKMMEEDNSKVLSLEQRLKQKVFGQDEAISVIAKAVRRSKVGINDPNRPLGVFLFLGPTGVGKTQTAKALAEELFDNENKIIRIDMSEYMEMHSVSKLIGSPPGYVGYGTGGELTEAVRNNPYSIVLFDELEKAHPRVLDLLLQIFDDGRLSDSEGRVINFKNTLIIMTSNVRVYSSYDNLGKTKIKDEIGSEQLRLKSEQDIANQLKEYFKPEFINRIDHNVVFKRLEDVHIDMLISRLEKELNQRLVDKEFRVLVGDNLRKKLIDIGKNSSFGGRSVRSFFQSLVVDATSERLLNYQDIKGSWLIDMDDKGRIYWDTALLYQKCLPPAVG